MRRNIFRKIIVLFLFVSVLSLIGCASVNSEKTDVSDTSSSSDVTTSSESKGSHYDETSEQSMLTDLTSESSQIVAESTATPTPTPLPLPTDTPTPTPLPTSTPIPTQTPIPSPTNTPMPTATNTPTPTSKPVLDKAQARTVAADALAYSYTGKNCKGAYRYDVNGDGIKDMILLDENYGFILACSDKDKVVLCSFENHNANLCFYSSSKLKKLIFAEFKGVSTYGCEWYYSFKNGKIHEDAYCLEEWYDYDLGQHIDPPKTTYKVDGKDASENKYNKKIKSYGKLKELKKVKKYTVRQTSIPSELIPEMFDYLRDDILGHGGIVDYDGAIGKTDLNNDGIIDCFFTIDYFSEETNDYNFPGVSCSGYDGYDKNHDWMSTSVVLLSTKNGVEARYFSSKDCIKYLKNLIN